jgi:predicted ester cyclase
MSTVFEEKIEGLVKKTLDEWNKCYDTWEKWCDKLYDPKCVFEVAFTDKLMTLKEYKEYRKEFLQAFPDSKMLPPDDLISETDTVSVRYKVKMTWKGEFLGKKPNDKTATLNIQEFVYFNEKGKVFEYHEIGDTLPVLQQLGIIPKG